MTILKEKRYLSIEDCSMRLRHTTVRLKGKAFYVEAVSDLAMNLLGNFLGTGEKLYVNASDDDLDISSPLLGNCYSEGESLIYLTRGTDRSSRQGIDTERIYCYYDGGTLRRGFPFGLQALGKTIDGEFPSFDTSLDEVRSSRSKSFGRPIGRYLSLWKTGDKGILRVRHLVHDVGLLFTADKTCLLTEKFNEPRIKAKLSPYVEIL